MTYEEALEYELTRREALQFWHEHGLSVGEFREELGDRSHYMGKELLDVLGY